MTRIYLAARYFRLDELNGYAEQLRAMGFTVDARWLKGAHRFSDDALSVEAATDQISLVGLRFAQDDYEDVRDADWVLCFTEKVRSGHSRGGRHVEMGLALAWRKRVVVIGPRENVFCCLPQVEHYIDFKEFTDLEELPSLVQFSASIDAPSPVGT